MVKRTVVVLGIASLVIMMAGSAMAFGLNAPCFGSVSAPRPLFVPVDCPDQIQKTIVKKWECKIVGPCPPAGMPARGSACGNNDRMGVLLSLATAVMTPFDVLFGPYDGVYGCLEMGSGGPCGSCPGGPIPRALMVLTDTCLPTGNSFFGGLW
jgi:hypothetical protein